ncbi:MgtC/SapB family protein [Marinobacter zhejiangensis]|uniref:Uncharacterized membrane protein, DUF4010 family n=1 Tax=Marinobacter zhejiangensis TaxID=488535 RepID=A0A1I4NFH2_9GAMM|nr:MgtC/SapB family protein [Marinobacter zhejiangensis]SFM14057.1 Uncharacterized membrane protein, DUF4010 family [Marinobacter zhejiangensis]
MDEVANQFIVQHSITLKLAAALLLGALIGLQRGWSARDRKSGERIAGIRTYALTGLLGGMAALLTETLTAWAFPITLISLVGAALVSYHQRLLENHDFSITSILGLILTFCFGAVAVAVDPFPAAAAAVATAIILDNKDEIHGWVRKLQAREMDAALKLLLISVVMLPLLPNTNMGPGGVLNPYEIWWMVVLIATVSFVGYFAMQLAGAAKGILFTSMFAGLTSSTALTLHFSRLSREAPSLNPQLASGILIACGTMFPRILIFCALINRDLLPSLVWPVVTMTLVLYIPALAIWYLNRAALSVEQPQLNQNPLDLKAALVFGMLLTAILFFGEILKTWFGDAGVYALAATSGVADVDAITLSLTRMSQSSISADTAVLGIVIAAAVNNLVKTGLAMSIGTRSLGLRVAVPMSLSMVAGLVTLWLL